MYSKILGWMCHISCDEGDNGFATLKCMTDPFRACFSHMIEEEGRNLPPLNSCLTPSWWIPATSVQFLSQRSPTLRDKCSLWLHTGISVVLQPVEYFLWLHFVPKLSETDLCQRRPVLVTPAFRRQPSHEWIETLTGLGLDVIMTKMFLPVTFDYSLQSLRNILRDILRNQPGPIITRTYVSYFQKGPFLEMFENCSGVATTMIWLQMPVRVSIAVWDSLSVK